MSNRAVIFVGTADRLLENRRIRGDALDAVAIDQFLQVALGDEAAGQEIQPDRLAVVFECFDGIHDGLVLFEPVFFGFPHHPAGSRMLSTSPYRGCRRQEYAAPPGITPFTTYRSRGNWRFGGNSRGGFCKRTEKSGAHRLRLRQPSNCRSAIRTTLPFA